MENKNLISFGGITIRKVWSDDEWFFSIVDVIEILTDSPQPASYWNKVKKTILKESQAKNGLKKQKIPNCLLNALGTFIKPKVIPMTGLPPDGNVPTQ